MKTTAILFLLCACVCGADTTTTNIVGDITTKITERTAKDGKLNRRVEQVFRGDQRIMVSLSKPDTQGVLAVRSRSYYAGRDLVTIESDEDGDGFFESLAVYHPGTEDMEAFTRQRDGSVRPVSTQTLRAFKKQNAALSEFWDKAFDKDSDTEKVGELMRETQQKIRAAAKEKTNEKK